MSNYATPCGGCLCNTCINSFANDHVKAGEAGLPISNNEIVLFKLAIEFGDLDKYFESA